MRARVRLLTRALPLTLALATTPGCSMGEESPACNHLVNDGPTVMATTLTTAPPTPTGGMVVDGLYELTASNLFGAPAGFSSSDTFNAVFEVEGNVMQQVGRINGDERRYTSTYTISGSTISTVDTCPAPDSGSYGISADATGFTIYTTQSGLTLEQVYRKR